MVFVLHTPLEIKCILIFNFSFSFLSPLLISIVNLLFAVFKRMLAFLYCYFPCFLSFFLSSFFLSISLFSLICFSFCFPFLIFSYLFACFHFYFLFISFFLYYFPPFSLFCPFPFSFFSPLIPVVSVSGAQSLARWGLGNLLWRHCRAVDGQPG